MAGTNSSPKTSGHISLKHDTPVGFKSKSVGVNDLLRAQIEKKRLLVSFS